jgi:hypothetical protein
MSLAPQLIVAISKFDGAGEKNVIEGASVVITRRAGGAQNIYSDEAGATLISQPAYTDVNGELKFFIADGAYTYTVQGQTYSVDVNSSQSATFNTVTAELFIADQFLGREIILEDASYGRVLVRDIADNTHYAEFKYEAPGNRATLSRTGYIHFDMSPTYVADYDQVGAPILKGETTRTRLYRGGAEILDLTSNLLKLGFSASLSILDADISASSVRVKNPNGTYPLSSAGGTLSLERPDGVDVLVSNSGVTNLASYNGGNLLTSTSSITALSSPAGQSIISGTATTTTINAGNGTQALSIDSVGGVLAINDFTFSSGKAVYGDFSNAAHSARTRFVSSSVNSNSAVGASPSGSATGAGFIGYNSSDVGNCSIARLFCDSSGSSILSSTTGSGTLLPLKIQVGSYIHLFDTVGAVTFSNNVTATNFYGNGYNLTQLNASEVKNGLLPSNIFPSTISAASVTFDNTLRAKGGTAYNLLDITSAASILRDSAGNDVFNASTTALALKRANNIVLNATSTATNLFNHAGNVRANFDASNSQIFSPATVPFISATTSTATITSGNGATCLTIDSTGAGLMRFPVFTVGTVPSASANADRVIIVSNASLGRGLYTSDATNWRSAQSGTILS